MSSAGVPSLFSLSLAVVARDVPRFAGRLHALSLEVGEALYRALPQPRLEDLRAFAWAFWRPVALSMVGTEGLSSASLRHLHLFSTCLHRLDLSNCRWLSDLQALEGLPLLECLNLRWCINLDNDSLAYIQRLPSLRCLDLEGVASISDAQAAHYIPVGMATLEAITYGLRLQRWRREEEASRKATQAAQVEDASKPFWERDPQQSKRRRVAVPVGSSATAVGSEADKGPWPLSRIVYLRLQDTSITPAAVEHFCVLDGVQLVDVRGTKVAIPGVQPLLGRFNLTHHPNEKKLLARSNAVLIAAMQGACGCSAMGLAIGTNPEGMEAVLADRAKAPWLRGWEQQGVVQLLGEATREDSKRHARAQGR